MTATPRHPLLTIVLLSAVIASRAQAADDEPPMRVVVVRNIVAPKTKTSRGGSARTVDHAAEAAKRFEATLASLNLVAVTRADLATCRAQECLRRARAETGASHLLNLEASYDEKLNSYSVSVSMFETASGVEISNKSDRCPRDGCIASEMIQSIVTLVTEAVTRAREAARAVRRVPPSPAAVIAPAEPPAPVSTSVVPPTSSVHGSPSPRRGRGFGWWAVGGGAGLAVAGGIVLGSNGQLADCSDSKNDLSCRTAWNTRPLGGTLLGVGSVAMVVGVLDLVGLFGSGSSSQETAIRIGPSSVTFAGRF